MELVATGARVVGVVASALAVWAGGSGVCRWWVDRRLRLELEQQLRRLERLCFRLTAMAVLLEVRLIEGVGWAGWNLWPDRLKGELIYLESLQGEAEESTAYLRALDASGGLERLRSDTEEIASCIATAARYYFDGTLHAYRDASGEALQRGASGSTPVLVLTDGGAHEVKVLRARTNLLFRTCLHRFGTPQHDPIVDRARWPLLQWESADADVDRLWGGEPRPLHWG